MKRTGVLAAHINIHSISIFVFAITVFFALFGTSGYRSPVASAETRFTETSTKGLSIVPASCPSSAPHFAGDTGLPNCSVNNNDPRGWLDGATCDAVGWAQDLDAPNTPIDVHFYIDGPVAPGFATFAGQVSASQSRSDLCSAIGSCNHGFTFTIPAQYRDGNVHTIYAYGINNATGGNNPQLSGSPKTFQCGTPITPSTNPPVDPSGTPTNGTCPVGYILVGSTCQFSACPSGYVLVGSQCVASSCPEGYILQGGVCVPSVCPTGYTLINGVCTSAQCTPSLICGTGVNSNNVVNSCSGAVVDVCTNYGAHWTCQGGVCVKPPPPVVTLKVTPLLVRRNETVQVEWSSDRVDGCVLSSNGGDSWTATDSAPRTSKPITSQTVFTLTCDGIDGTTAEVIKTVNIIPFFEETCDAGFTHVNGVCVPQ